MSIFPCSENLSREYSHASTCNFKKKSIWVLSSTFIDFIDWIHVEWSIHIHQHFLVSFLSAFVFTPIAYKMLTSHSKYNYIFGLILFQRSFSNKAYFFSRKINESILNETELFFAYFLITFHFLCKVVKGQQLKFM